MAFACGFLLVVGTSFICAFSSNRWNSHPVNSTPLSWTHCSGHGYCANQLCENFCATFLAVFSSIRTNSTRAVTVSMAVSALNSYGLPCTFTFQGPIRSTATSSNGSDQTSCSGSKPYPLPSNLCFWQSMYRNLSISDRNSGCQYLT